MDSHRESRKDEQEVSIQVNETSIPYPTYYFYAIYCVTTREYHGGGGTWFNARGTVYGAKCYKSAKTTSKYAQAFTKSYSGNREFIVMEHRVHATRFFNLVEQEELLNG